MEKVRISLQYLRKKYYSIMSLKSENYDLTKKNKVRIYISYSNSKNIILIHIIYKTNVINISKNHFSCSH